MFLGILKMQTKVETGNYRKSRDLTKNVKLWLTLYDHFYILKYAE